MENKKSLYREYRPKNFDQVAGHEGIKKILISQIQNNTFSHAILFFGQRGTGKTSVAKIFAKVVNCQNLVDYNPCESCLSCKEANANSHSDIFEIDAASNNGVEEIRNIKANVSLLPSFSKYKIYIIDEVHMLSNSAFNALLKTLEEPPKHVIFILATTEFSKILPTIISRCQLFNFKKISQVSLENKIEEICKLEGKEISKEALKEIFYMSDGSLRDALNFLEQALTIANHKVGIEDLKKIFYIATKKEKLDILKNVFEGKLEQIISYFEISNQKGIDFQTMTLSLLDFLKEIIETKLTNNFSFLKNLNEEEFEYFKNKPTAKLFELADNISEAYTKSKNSNIGFQYILINILKSVLLGELISLPQNQNVFLNSKAIIPFDDEKKHESNKKAIEPVIQEQTYDFENTRSNFLEKNEDQNLILQNQTEKNFNNQKEIDEALNSNEETKLLKLQMKFLVAEANIYKNQIVFSNDQIINVLVGANKNARSFFENKIQNLFNKEIEKKDYSFIEKFVMLFGTKISAASDNSIILVCEERTIAKWINNKLQDWNVREALFKYFEKEVIILALDKKRWAEIKFEFMSRKQNNILNSYIELNVNNFYDSLVLKIDQEESEYLKRARELLGPQNIKVVK